MEKNDRREFIKSAAAAGAGTGLAALLANHVLAQDDQPLFQISVAQWSLHNTLFDKKMDNLDFARVARQELAIGAVEYVNQFFSDKATDKDYLDNMKKVAEDNNVKNLLIMIDGEGSLGDASLQKRVSAVENHFKWVEAAKHLGCHSVRVNAASSGSYEDQLFRAADGLRALTEFAVEHDLNVIVENHGGLSSNGAWLAKVIETVNHPNCGTLPDFGNFHLGEGKHYDRYKGVIELMPYAKSVSAKSHDFDEDGNEIHTDYLRMMKIVLGAGYRGHVGIEYEGSKLPEIEGILATKKLLERVRETLNQILLQR